MILESFLQWWNNVDPYVSFGLAILGIIGFVLSFYFYYKSIRNKEVSFSIRSVTVLRENSHYNKLQFIYDNKFVKNLTATKLAFWNSGDFTIDHKDLIPQSSLRIHVPSPETIYDIEIMSVCELTNNFSLSPIDGSTYQILFDYIDKNQGCVIKVLHSSDFDVSTMLLGKLKGIPKFKYVGTVRNDLLADENTSKLRRFFIKRLHWFLWVVFLICLFGSWYIPIMVGFSIITFFLLIVYYRSNDLPDPLVRAFLKS